MPTLLELVNRPPQGDLANNGTGLSAIIGGVYPSLKSMYAIAQHFTNLVSLLYFSRLPFFICHH